MFSLKVGMNCNWGESQTYVAVASIRGYENTDKESSTRANV
ncbi:hypothetical protein NXW94_21820 [Bacteroides ovatus]|nr:hypothetical protein [Bacteroides ovatus]